MGKTARAVCAESAETQGRVSLDCESEQRASARTCRREPGKSRSENGGSCFGDGRNQDEPKVRHFVIQNATLVTTTRTEGARVVLTLPVTRKRLRRESETSGHDARNVAAVKTMPRSKRSRTVRAVVGLLATLASAAENCTRFSAALVVRLCVGHFENVK